MKFDKALTSAPYKNPNLAIEERVSDLLARMTIEEKVAQMMCVWNEKKGSLTNEDGSFSEELAIKHFGHGNGIGQIGRPSDANKDEESTHASGFNARETVELTNAIQQFFIENSRLGIPVFFHEECLHGLASKDATSFPQPIALGGTFNTELVNQLYTMTAKEARKRGAHQALTPVLDVARDPRWGRVEETFGEDPFLVSEMGKAAVFGFQGDAEFNTKNHVVATLKHFAAHGEPESGQNCGPVNISERVLRETFLMPFKEAIQVAGAISVMPSYNEIDGVPSHSNKWLLDDVLRKEWDFEGYTVSDYYAIWELHYREASHGHFLASDKKQAAELAVKAGVNMELPEPDCYQFIPALIQEGKLSEKEIDKLVYPMLYWKFKMGLFEDPYNDPDEAELLSGAEEQRPIALRAAQEVITLLKNKDNTLPLNKKVLKKVAVIGPNAAVSTLGGYSGYPKYNSTALEGIKVALGDGVEVVYHEGCKITIGGAWEKDEVVTSKIEDDLSSIQEAVQISKDADAIILVIGGNDQTAREAWSRNHMGDRSELELFGQQNELLDQLSELEIPLISVLYNGRPLVLNNVAEKSDAILECWSGGQESGHALASVLFGDFNPGGKLPISFPKSVGQLPIYYNYKPSARRGFLFDDAQPLYPFGFGLSYTKFELSEINLQNTKISKDGQTYVNLTIKNIGEVYGSEVIQMYVRDKVSSVTRPIKELKGFKKLFMDPGESKNVEIPITVKSLAFYNINKEYVVEPGEFEIMVGTSSRGEDLESVILTVTE